MRIGFRKNWFMIQKWMMLVQKEIGDTVINKCIEALGEIRAGIQLLVEDDISFDAFCFMNRSMILQRIL